MFCLGCAMSDLPKPQANLNKKEALAIARKTLASMPQGDDYAIQEADTVEKPCGWMFFYNTKAYLETKNPIDMRQEMVPSS